MKKISIVLVFILVLLNINVCAADYTILLDEQFDSDITNAAPMTGELASQNTFAFVEEAKGGKALNLSADKGSMGIAYSFTPSGKIQWIDMILSSSGSPAKLSVKDSSNKLLDILTMYDNYMEIIGGKQAKIKRSEMINVSVRYNSETKMLRVYLGENEIASDIFLSGLSSLTGVTISAFCETETVILLDDIKVYESFERVSRSLFEKKKLNTVRIEKSELQDFIHEEKEYFNLSFDNDALSTTPAGVMAYENGGKVTVVSERTRPGKEMALIRNNNANTYIDVRFETGTVVDKTSFVMEADIMATKGTAKVQLMTLRDVNGQFLNIINQLPAGNIALNSGEGLAGNLTGKWTHIAVVCDFEERVFDVYINDELKADKIPFPNPAFGRKVQFMRFYFDPGISSKEEFLIDNILAYSGTKIREKAEIIPEDTEETHEEAVETNDLDSKEVPEKLFASFSDVRDRLYGSVAFVIDSYGMLAGGKRIKMDVKTYVQDGRTMIPLRYISEGFGCKVEYNSDTQTAIIDGRIEARANTNILKIDGKEVKMDANSIISDGRMFLPIRYIAEDGLNKKVYNDMLGNVIIGDNESIVDENTEFKFAKKISFYIATDLPTANEILSDFNRVSPNNEHPRLFAKKDDFDRIKTNYDSGDEYTVSTINKLLNNANGLLIQRLPFYNVYAHGVLERMVTIDNFMCLYIAYLITEDQRYVDRAAQFADALASYPDFHEYISLDCAEHTAYAGAAYDLFYHLFPQELLDKLKDAIMNKGLKFAMNASKRIAYPMQNDYSRWDTNWNLVCNGGFTVGAVALLGEEPEFCSQLLQFVLNSIQFAAIDYAPDGAWKEGPSYWNYATLWFTNLMATLTSATGTNYGVIDIPGVSQACYAQIYSSGEKGLFALHDASTNAVPNHPVFRWYAKELNDDNLSIERDILMDIFNLQPTVWDLIWYNPDIKATTVSLPMDKIMRFAEVGAMRSGYGKGEAWLAFAAGDNSVTHGDLHMGTFTFEMLGERWAEEMGSDDYSLNGYFNENIRYDYYVAATEGQNCYVINPKEKGHGNQEYRSLGSLELVESKPRGAISKVSLTDAYRRQVNNALRGYMLNDNRMAITIQDEISLKQTSEIYWFMHTNSDIEISEDKRSAVLTIKGKKIQMEVESDYDFEIMSMPARPLDTSPQFKDQLLNATCKTKLAVYLPEAKDDVTIKVSFVPYGSESSYQGIIPINQWKIPDGEPVRVHANAIYVDGEAIPDFSDEVFSYTASIDYGKVPVISVDSDTKYEIIQPTSENNSATIKVENPEQPYAPSIYSINFVSESKAGRPEGKKIEIKSGTASHEPQPENPIKAAIDGDLKTRWSAEGEQWYQLDLGENKNIGEVGIYFMNTDGRINIFDISISNDGVNFEKIFKGQSCGVVEDWEKLSFSGVKARYLRYEAHGNNLHNWNSIIEIEVYE